MDRADTTQAVKRDVLKTVLQKSQATLLNFSVLASALIIFGTLFGLLSCYKLAVFSRLSTAIDMSALIVVSIGGLLFWLAQSIWKVNARSVREYVRMVLLEAGILRLLLLDYDCDVISSIKKRTSFGLYTSGILKPDSFVERAQLFEQHFGQICNSQGFAAYPLSLFRFIKGIYFGTCLAFACVLLLNGLDSLDQESYVRMLLASLGIVFCGMNVWIVCRAKHSLTLVLVEILDNKIH